MLLHLVVGITRIIIVRKVFLKIDKERLYVLVNFLHKVYALYSRYGVTLMH